MFAVEAAVEFAAAATRGWIASEAIAAALAVVASEAYKCGPQPHWQAIA